MFLKNRNISSKIKRSKVPDYAALNDNNLNSWKHVLSKHLKSGHHQPASETPFEWRFTGGPMVAQHCLLAGSDPIFDINMIHSNS